MVQSEVATDKAVRFLPDVCIEISHMYSVRTMYCTYKKAGGISLYVKDVPDKSEEIKL
jgi:hypothetical protein